MTIDDLVQLAVARQLTEADLQQASAALRLPVPDLFDAFSREVAEGYSKKKYSWSDADAAVNQLTPLGVSDERLSKYAFGVYLAFDEGEYRHPGDPKDFDHEIRTRALLLELHEKKAGH